MTPKEKIEAVAAELGITMTTVFVPWSQSRNKGEKQPSLNWEVTLHRKVGPGDGGVTVLTTDYSAGYGHCPSYKPRATIFSDKAVRFECKHGHAALGDNDCCFTAGKAILPEFADVLHSLASEAEVLDRSSFEEWASELGYDTDSRKAEGVYRACLEIALKLRNALGEDGLKKLQEACQDY